MIFKATARKYKILCLGILALLGVLIYSNSFYNPFCFDDGLYITGNPAIRNIANLKAIWNYFPSRFITFATLALNYRFNSFSVFGYHLVNFIMHLSCAMLVFWLANLILSTPSMQKDKITALAKPFALFTGLMFLSHPVQTEAVVYIWQRSALLVALFYFLSLCLYIKARLLQINGNAPKAKVFYIFSLVSALVSMFSKENSVTLPIMIILCEFYFFKQPGRRHLKPVLPFLVLLPVIPAVLFFAKPETYSDIERLFYKPADTGFYYFITQLRVFITYLRLVFVPVNQNIDYDYPVMKSIFQPQVFLSLLIVVVILFAAFKLYKKYRLLSFAIIWFFIALLPESSIVPLKDIIFEHRLYLPLAAFSIFFVAVLCYLLRENKTKILVSILSMVIVVCSFVAHQRNKVWQDEVMLWTDAARKSPNKARVYNNRGSAYMNKGSFDSAIADFNKAIELSPDYAEAYRNRGVAYYSKDNLSQATEDFTKAIKINPKYADSYSNLGVVYIKQDDFSQAIEYLNKAIQINPYNADSYSNRGIAYASTGSLDKAISDFDKVIKLNPDSSDAYTNRAVACVNKGDFRQAISDFSNAIRINPGNTYAYYNRAVSYFYDKDYDKSWKDIYKAEELGYKIDPVFLEQLKKASNSFKDSSAR